MVHALRDACAYYARCAQRFGDPFTLPTPFGPLVMTGRPEGIRTIYGVNPEYLDIFVEELQPFLGSTSVMQTSGQEHLRRRQLLSPVFTRSSLAGYCATMSDVAAGFAASLKPGDHFVAQQAMHDLSLQIILRVFFGTQESQLEAGPWARLTAALDTLDATIRKVIADRSAGSGTAD
jgi:cytochrome P450 family 110